MYLNPLDTRWPKKKKEYKSLPSNEVLTLGLMERSHPYVRRWRHAYAMSAPIDFWTLMMGSDLFLVDLDWESNQGLDLDPRLAYIIIIFNWRKREKYLRNSDWWPFYIRAQPVDFTIRTYIINGSLWYISLCVCIVI